MFQLVNVDQLQLNQYYKIVANNYEFKGRYKGRRFDVSLEFDKLVNVTIDRYLVRTNFKYTQAMYAFVSKNPQWQMERRAVNMIVQRVIGDEYFVW